MKTIREIKKESADYGFSDYLKGLRDLEGSSELSSNRPLRVAVLRSYTSEMLEPVLKFRLLLEDWSPEFFFGGYNGYAQEILDPASPLYAFNPDIILLMVRMEELVPEFIDEFGGKPPAFWENSLREAALRIGSLCATVEKRIPSRIIVQNFSLARPYWGIYDAQSPDGQTHLTGALNRFLAEELKGRKNVFIWDFERLVSRKGFDNIHDSKMWHTSRNPFRRSAYVHMADDLLRLILSADGRVKKCVVLDLDNTLWGGIAGEDGIDGVKLGHEYPGNCYREFQKGLLKLYNRGVILALNSKNNEADALDIIENHPYMVLKARHFAAMRINWDDKVSNLRAIAAELNIGLESMIFIDDNHVECELVRARLPEVEVVTLPEKPYLIPSVPDSLPGVENVRLTDEDRNKGEMYRSQIERKRFEQSFESLDGFLAGLDIEVCIEAASGFSIARIAQLTQKTNQMNLTTRRYTEANIQAFADDPDIHVFSASSRDRFGDNGIIGVFILRIKGDECIIDTFLLSCRVIGRNIEGVMMAFIAEFAKRRGVKTLLGEYLPTAKNKPAVDMYEKMGFLGIGEGLFSADLEKTDFRYPPYIKAVVKPSV